MKHYLILHHGFKKPTPEQMEGWKKWFEMIKDKQVDRGGFRGGFKITESGTDELPFGEDSLTGYTIIKAQDLEEAKEIAAECPIVESTRVYEIHKG
jgi:hypothetical protein